MIGGGMVKGDKSITKDGDFDDPEERQEIREAVAFVWTIHPLLAPFVAVFQNRKALAVVIVSVGVIAAWIKPELIKPFLDIFRGTP